MNASCWRPDVPRTAQVVISVAPRVDTISRVMRSWLSPVATVAHRSPLLPVDEPHPRWSARAPVSTPGAMLTERLSSRAPLRVCPTQHQPERRKECNIGVIVTGNFVVYYFTVLPRGGDACRLTKLLTLIVSVSLKSGEGETLSRNIVTYSV